MRRPALIAAGLTAGLVAALTVAALWLFAQPDRVTLTPPDEGTRTDDNAAGVAAQGGDAEPQPERTAVLLFGTDGGDLTADDAARFDVPDYAARQGGLRTDALTLAVAEGDDAVAISIPRDTWVRTHERRINELLQHEGGDALADAVAELTGIRPDHLVGINFRGFVDLVDAAGGVDVTIDAPLRDDDAHLYLPEAGCLTLDGRTALAYARSRQTQQQTADGRWVPDASASDFGRIGRQRELALTVWHDLRDEGLVRQAGELVRTVRDDLILDDQLRPADLPDLAALAGDLTASDLRTATLDGELARRQGQSVVTVDTDAARRAVTSLLTDAGSTPEEAPTPDEPDSTAAADPDGDGDGEEPAPLRDTDDGDVDRGDACTPIEELHRRYGTMPPS